MVENRVLQDLVKENLSTYEIAKRLCCSQTNVRYWMNKHGLHSNFGPHGNGRRTRSPRDAAARIVEHVMIHRKRLKARAIAYKGGKCMLCGYNTRNSALEFHHLNKATKSFGLSKKG